MEENFDEFIDESLFTEDGFINPVAQNKLENAIKNMKPSYERLANDHEWSAKRWTFIKEILGSFAKYSIQLSPYGMPENLEKVLKYLEACLRKSYEWDVVEGKHWAQISLCEINKMLHDILGDFNLVLEWNEKKKDTRRDPDDPDTDFIDIHALFHQVCIDIRTDRREFDRFNEEFERNHS